MIEILKKLRYRNLKFLKVVDLQSFIKFSEEILNFLLANI